MAERRGLWPLLVYGVLVATAATRQAQTERTRASGNRKIDAAPDESSEILGESRPATQVDADKRPREQVENDQPVSAQLRRAKEQGRGRHAVAPWHIPSAGWKDIFWRVYVSVNDNRLLAVAAGVVFYSLLAIFPAIAAFVSLYGLIADASTIDSHLSLAAGIFSRRRGRHTSRTDHAAYGKKRCKAQPRFHNRTCGRPLERQRRNEGDHRRAQRRL